MKERPIIFSDEMVRAILEGRKTQTRRVIEPQPVLSEGDNPSWSWRWGEAKPPQLSRYHRIERFKEHLADFCPYGRPGDRLWVKEKWQARNLQGKWWHEVPTNERSLHNWAYTNPRTPAYPDAPQRWMPLIYMPRWASRITLEIVSVRAERVQEISEDAARAEGVDTEYIPFNHNGRIIQMDIRSPRAHFAKIWDSINVKRGYGWDLNPWVWVVEFRRVGNE